MRVGNGQRTDGSRRWRRCSLAPPCSRCPGPPPATPVVKFKAEPLPIPGYPAHGLHPRRRDRAAGRIPDHGNRIRRLPAAADPRRLRSARRGADCILQASRPVPPPRWNQAARGRGRARRDRSPVSARLPASWRSANRSSVRTTSIEAFYAAGGGLEFFTFGHEPALIEIISQGHYVRGGRAVLERARIGHPTRGNRARAPRTPRSKRSRSRSGPRCARVASTIFYGRLPKACPRGYLPVAPR